VRGKEKENLFVVLGLVSSAVGADVVGHFVGRRCHWLGMWWWPPLVVIQAVSSDTGSSANTSEYLHECLE
jgi:hypothetical protein